MAPRSSRDRAQDLRPYLAGPDTDSGYATGRGGGSSSGRRRRRWQPRGGIIWDGSLGGPKEGAGVIENGGSRKGMVGGVEKWRDRRNPEQVVPGASAG